MQRYAGGTSGVAGKKSARGKATVLVGENELFVRMIAVDAIEDAGYATIEARRTRIGASGTRTLAGLPLILTSGHLRQDDATVPASIPFLQKPYRAAMLLGELARQLDQAQR